MNLLLRSIKLFFLSQILFTLIACSQDLKTGAEQMELYLPLLKNKSVGLIANHSSMINNVHLLDTLLSHGIKVKKIFCPEHGFRGTAEAGEIINNAIDKKTKLPIVSLYGNNKKPSSDELKDIDVLLFDIQDVGVRYYTYISTMHFAMEACAENNKEMIVLDRPNPNGFYVDGPVLETKYRSFVGLHPIPLVHGLTVGELALMINGEKWLNNSLVCSLKVIPCMGYTHNTKYKLPVKPSPNLPNMQSVYLYPVLGLLEGTALSCGRGTPFPFQVWGHPSYPDTLFSFTPAETKISKYPLFKNKTCYGDDLRNYNFKNNGQTIQLSILLEAYRLFPDKSVFFNNFFFNLSGTAQLRKQIEENLSEEAIRQSWQDDLQNYLNLRSRYLLYEDFTDKHK